MVYNQEQLKSVGEYLKQFLDPFGIDVSYYVDNLAGRSATSSTSEGKKEEEKKSDETATAKPEKPLQDEEKKGEEKSATQMDTDQAADKTSTASVITTAATTTTTTTTDVAADPIVKDDLIDLTKPTTSTATAPPAPASSTSLFQAAASALENVIKNPTGVEASTKPAARPDQEFHGFNLIDMEKEIKFINCIEQLKSMGYSDDGGWLTRLVISKDGNLNAVLDSLHPSKN